MCKDTTYRIVLDNGGGIVLQLGAEYAHYYQDAKQAADDLRTYLADGNTDGWDGHDEDALSVEPTDEEIRNGGYRVFTDYEDLNLGSSWHNEVRLAEELASAGGAL